ncbi:hypothetical protein GQ44DRAFT_732667 [Phaeosphaeriaceae sp. PMI808]|nr:hypothetical protein GQ44DRAFT_732667 [Phaeosphaeriaceae sp. PMI808]
MDDFFDNITVTNLDDSERYEFSGIARAMRLSRFKSVVAMKIQRAQGRYVSAADLELTAFGALMTDGEMTLAEYGIEDDMTLTRVDVVPDPNPGPAGPRSRNNAGGQAQNPPPYPGVGNVNAAPPAGKRLSNIFFQGDHRTYTLNDVPINSTVEDLFQRLSGKGVDKNQGDIFLIFGGKTLAGRELTLIDYNVQEEFWSSFGPSS